jgi:phosphatidate cytidylyltransferase
LLSLVYAVTIVGCFVAIVALFMHSPLYLLSVMALVWIADIGAYFSGKAFGKRKLAPSISPGKSWEGAIGGGIAVLVIAAITIFAAPSAPWLQDTFAVQLQLRRGWPMALLVLLVLVAASIVGDLFESQLKRRAGIKDSSNLLPGHGGVLDRIDALIPVLPFAALVGSWL